MLYDLIIVGAGPAGVTAAIYAARKRLKTLVLSKDFWGQPSKTSWVDNYPGLPHIRGLDLARAFEKHLRSFEDGDILTLKQEEVTGLACHPEAEPKDPVVRQRDSSPRYPSAQNDTGGRVQNDTFIVTTASGHEYRARTLIIATGRDPRPLEVPGEKALIGKGVSYCSTCDASFFKGKRVAVIGGGNSGLEAALDLAQYAERIYILEYTDRLKADQILQDRVAGLGAIPRRLGGGNGVLKPEQPRPRPSRKEPPRIEVFLNKKLTKIEGKNKVEDIVYQDTKTKKTFQLGVDGVFVAAGTVPITYFAKEIVDLNAHDEIIVDPQTCTTSQPGVFAAGDVNNTKWKQIVMATAQGARAALAAYEYLKSTDSTPPTGEVGLGRLHC